MRRIGDVSQDLLDKWARNAARHSREADATRERIEEGYNRIRGVAPGTPVDAAPVVLDMPPRDDEQQCARCQNMRFVMGDDGSLKPCPACGVADRWRMASVEAFSSMNARAASQTFASYSATDAATKRLRDAAQTFAREPKGWLTICGSRGMGKSHLCAAIANDLRGRNVGCLFVGEVDLFRSLYETVRNDSPDAPTLSQRVGVYQRAPVLIVDDIGTEKRSEFTDARMFEIADWRYRNNAPTVFVSNFDLSRDDAPMEKRVIDRIRAGVVVVAQGKSKRSEVQP